MKRLSSDPTEPVGRGLGTTRIYAVIVLSKLHRRWVNGAANLPFGSVGQPLRYKRERGSIKMVSVSNIGVKSWVLAFGPSVSGESPVGVALAAVAAPVGGRCGHEPRRTPVGGRCGHSAMAKPRRGNGERSLSPRVARTTPLGGGSRGLRDGSHSDSERVQCAVDGACKATVSYRLGRVSLMLPPADSDVGIHAAAGRLGHGHSCCRRPTRT